MPHELYKLSLLNLQHIKGELGEVRLAERAPQAQALDSTGDQNLVSVVHLMIVSCCHGRLHPTASVLLHEGVVRSDRRMESLRRKAARVFLVQQLQLVARRLKRRERVHTRKVARIVHGLASPLVQLLVVTAAALALTCTFGQVGSVVWQVAC